MSVSELGSFLQQAAEAEGADAYLRGSPVRHCPYYSKSVSGKYWLTGWMQACMKLRNGEMSHALSWPVQ